MYILFLIFSGLICIGIFRWALRDPSTFLTIIGCCFFLWALVQLGGVWR